jgi:hypothetical protein
MLPYQYLKKHIFQYELYFEFMIIFLLKNTLAILEYFFILKNRKITLNIL